MTSNWIPPWLVGIASLFVLSYFSILLGNAELFSDHKSDTSFMIFMDICALSGMFGWRVHHLYRSYELQPLVGVYLPYTSYPQTIINWNKCLLLLTSGFFILHFLNVIDLPSLVEVIIGIAPFFGAICYSFRHETRHGERIRLIRIGVEPSDDHVPTLVVEAGGVRYVGYIMNGAPWEGTEYDRDGNITATYSSGVRKPIT